MGSRSGSSRVNSNALDMDLPMSFRPSYPSPGQHLTADGSQANIYSVVTAYDTVKTKSFEKIWIKYKDKGEDILAAERKIRYDCRSWLARSDTPGFTHVMVIVGSRAKIYHITKAKGTLQEFVGGSGRYLDMKFDGNELRQQIFHAVEIAHR